MALALALASILRRPPVVLDRPEARFSAANPKALKNIYAHCSAHGSVSPNLDAYWPDDKHHSRVNFSQKLDEN